MKLLDNVRATESLLDDSRRSAIVAGLPNRQMLPVIDSSKAAGVNDGRSDPADRGLSEPFSANQPLQSERAA